MHDYHINQLLLVIRSGKDISHLRSIGLEYSQIAQIITKSRKDKLITMRRGHLEVTKKGRAFIEEHTRYLNYKNNFIKPLYEKQIPKIGIDDIYLPSKEDLIN